MTSRHFLYAYAALLMVLLTCKQAVQAQAPSFSQPCPIAQTAHLPQETAKTLDSMVIIQNGAELGSGVLISRDGYLLTAAHVVSPARQVAVHLHSGEAILGQVLRMDLNRDIALVKIPGTQYACRPLQTQMPKVGMPVYGVGMALDTHRLTYQMTPAWVTRNIHADPNSLQTNANLPIGHSGGPFLNQKGEVVGIVSWKEQPAHAETRSYGASIPAIQHLLHQNP